MNNDRAKLHPRPLLIPQAHFPVLLCLRRTVHPGFKRSWGLGVNVRLMASVHVRTYICTHVLFLGGKGGMVCIHRCHTVSDGKVEASLAKNKKWYFLRIVRAKSAVIRLYRLERRVSSVKSYFIQVEMDDKRAGN
jgi:hypothetical protein